MGQSYRYALALVLLLFAVPSAHAQIYVDADASGAGDGSSWADAHPTLQDALDGAQSRDSILVAEGVYYPDEGSGVADGTADTSFVVTGDQDGLDIYGGFDPSEGATTFADRDADANVTVLSGDIDQDDANRTAEGITPTASDTVGTNSTHVFIFNGRRHQRGQQQPRPDPRRGGPCWDGCHGKCDPRDGPGWRDRHGRTGEWGRS